MNYLLNQGENRVALAYAIALVDKQLFPVAMTIYPYSYIRSFVMRPTTQIIQKIKEFSTSNYCVANFREEIDNWLWQVNLITQLERSQLIAKVKEEYEIVQRPAC